MTSPETFTKLVGAALPQAIAAILTGGFSAASNLGNSGVISSALKAAGQMLKSPMFKSSVAQTIGTSYENSVSEGATAPEAAVSAVLTSLINSFVELGGGLETLPAELRKGGTSAVKNWVKSMFDEGKEEVVQGMIENLTAKTVFDKDRPLASLSDQQAVINPKRAALEFGMGAAAGGILGGGQIMASNIMNARRAQKASQPPRGIVTAPTIENAYGAPTDSPTGGVTTRYSVRARTNTRCSTAH